MNETLIQEIAEAQIKSQTAVKSFLLTKQTINTIDNLSNTLGLTKWKIITLAIDNLNRQVQEQFKKQEQAQQKRAN